MRTAGLVLAAGAGRRLGGPKALLRTGGERFVDRAVRTLAGGGADPVLVVAGAAEVGHVDAVVVWNVAWASGIGSSLGAGLRAARAYADDVAPLDAVVVTLVDQPGISPRAVARVIAGVGDAPAAVATYAGSPLHPVLLRSATWEAAADAARGDRGARPYLDANADLVVRVACDGLGDPFDVDTPADLARLAARSA